MASISTSISSRGRPVKTVVRQGSTAPLVLAGDEVAVRVVHGREVLALGEVNPQHHHIVEGRAAGIDDRLDVLQRAGGLGRRHRRDVGTRWSRDRPVPGRRPARTGPCGRPGRRCAQGRGHRKWRRRTCRSCRTFHVLYAAGDQPSSSEMASAAARTCGRAASTCSWERSRSGTDIDTAATTAPVPSRIGTPMQFTKLSCSS